MSKTNRPRPNRTRGKDEGPVSTAADRLATLRRDDQRSTALRGVRPNELLDELATELERRGADDLRALVVAEQDRRTSIQAENRAVVDAATTLREDRERVCETFVRGLSITFPPDGRVAVLVEPARTMGGRAGWYVSTLGGAVRTFYDSDTLADVVIATGRTLLTPPTGAPMDEILFVRFHETNDNEGESWNWWLQSTGNQQELAKLAELLATDKNRFEDDGWFTLHLDEVEPRTVVDKLVQYAEDGYFSSHSVVTGTFTCPEYLDENRDDLYKGGIRDFFTTVP